ncbi:uncharacterized protein BDR25DRAFT_265268 [Lindgomyces ingoldianus]|uniref:Uncharacterized protein n=1 Tax=Lindgomyces ingoldianus TaxID=673940 RepID=A0ACB6QNQ3_9PLEO|nr:uncharacterized protein BDR25DRAFT_265268 [Lindgomyces ingoldianus]KAF2468536.1 hypothetical protein BDR25DRAFT_265268 [Lindgomyces ingoldianus]
MTFKVILTGVTGRIGGEVLQQCLKNASITLIVALTRRPLLNVEPDPKLEVVIMKDFTQYSDDVIAKLSGADGCIWCMTTPNFEPALELEYPLAFAKAFSKTLAQHNKHFRYLHLTGMAVERDQSKSLWLKGPMRKLKGKGEMQMIEVAKDPANSGLWETLIARPSGVVQGGTILGDVLVAMLGEKWTIRSDELALALVDMVMNGSEEQLVQAVQLLKRGQELMKTEEKIQTG